MPIHHRLAAEMGLFSRLASLASTHHICITTNAGQPRLSRAPPGSRCAEAFPGTQRTRGTRAEISAKGGRSGATWRLQAAQPCPILNGKANFRAGKGNHMAFTAQQQSVPGTQPQMHPIPDSGESTYRGSRKLLDKKAIVTGGTAASGAPSRTGRYSNWAVWTSTRASTRSATRNGITPSGSTWARISTSPRRPCRPCTPARRSSARPPNARRSMRCRPAMTRATSRGAGGRHGR